MNAQTPASTRTRSSDQLPAVPPPAHDGAFTISQRTISGLEHDISELVKELEQLGVDMVSRKRS
jgi:hypothetical protein